MNVAFAGTPEFAVPTLKAIIASRHRVVLVVTQPDRPAGRSSRPVPPPVKQAALEHGVPLIQPESINRADALARLREAAPDVLLVVAYGKILTRRVIDFTSHGTINIHASLLPKYRGAAPISRAILHGERETGVTLQRVALGVDTGPILMQRAVEIGPEEDAGQLNHRLAALAARIIAPGLDAIEEHRATETVQDESQVTYAPKLAKSDGLIPWEREAAAVHNLVRAMTPWPGAFTFHHPAGGGKAERLILLAARVADWSGPAARPGTILSAGPEPLVACGRGCLKLLQVKPEGSRPMEAAAWVRGHSIHPGDQFRGES